MMSALDFPNSPVLNQQWTGSNGALYSWDGAVWNITTIQPGTTAGGELAGSYPNPTIAPTTVVAGSYGSSTSIPAFHVRSDGRLDSVTPVAVSIPPGTAIGPNPPASPIPGQLWWRSDPDSNLYIYYDDGDSQQFVAAVPGSMASGVCKIGATPPATPQNGQLWWRNDPDGVLYVYYDDGNSKQFVPAAPIAQNFWSVSGGALTPTDATKVVALAPISDTLRWGVDTVKGRLSAYAGGVSQWRLNATTTNALDDSTKPSWIVSLAATTDDFQIYHSPAGVTPAYASLLKLDASGNLTLNGVDGNTAGCTAKGIGTAVGGSFNGYQARGTGGAPTPTQSGDVLAYFMGFGCPTAGTFAAQGYMRFVANDNWLSGARGTGCYINTTPQGTSSATSQFVFDSAGNLTISNSIGQKLSGTTWSNPSDPRLKTDMGPYARGLAEITQLAPISYHLKSDPNGPLCYGFDASAVQAIFPECVGTTTAMLDGEETEVLSFDMHPILVAIVNAIKELAARN